MYLDSGDKQWQSITDEYEIFHSCIQSIFVLPCFFYNPLCVLFLLKAMDTTIDGIDEIKRQVQKQIESEEKEYAAEVTIDPDRDTISGFSSSDIVTALNNNESGDAVLFKTLFKKNRQLARGKTTNRQELCNQLPNYY